MDIIVKTNEYVCNILFTRLSNNLRLIDKTFVGTETILVTVEDTKLGSFTTGDG